MKNVNAMKINGHEIFYTPRIGWHWHQHWHGGSGIGNDSSLNVGIMPKPGQMKISRTWFIWLENSCTGIEVTFC
jgi:hypothetical protein